MNNTNYINIDTLVIALVHAIQPPFQLYQEIYIYLVGYSIASHKRDVLLFIWEIWDVIGLNCE